MDDVRFERDLRRAGNPYPPLRSPALGEGGSSAAGDAAGLRCADDVVQPRGRRWMKPPSDMPKRLPPPGEPGVVAPVPAPGDGRGSAVLEGERAKLGCEALADEGAGGVPAGLALEEDEADAVDDCMCRGRMSTAEGVGGAMAASRGRLVRSLECGVERGGGATGGHCREEGQRGSV